MPDWSPNLNPYAPTSVSSQRPPNARAKSRRAQASSLTICAGVIAACTTAGAMFGLLMFGTLMLFELFRNPSGTADVFRSEALIGFTVVMIAGALLAFLTAIVVVPVIFTLDWLRRSDSPLGASRERIHRFALVCGMVSGFLPLTVISGFDPRGMLFSLLPAAFGAIAARILIRPLSRAVSRVSAQNPWKSDSQDVLPHSSGSQDGLRQGLAGPTSQPLPDERTGNYAADTEMADPTRSGRNRDPDRKPSD